MFHTKLDDSKLWHDANFYRSSPNWCREHPIMLNHYLTLTKIKDGKMVEDCLQTLQHRSLTDLTENAHIIMSNAANALWGENNWRFKPDGSLPGGMAVSNNPLTIGDTISIESNFPTL